MLKKTTKGVIITIKVITKSSSSKILGKENNYLKIRLKSAPEKNKANIELITLLSKTFNIPKSNIEIITGKTSRLKHILLINQDLDYINSILYNN